MTPPAEYNTPVIVIGTSLAHFRITAKIGEGGMGEVYRAEDGKLGREVAIKVLPKALALDPERLARFQREAQVLAQLHHPHIASIFGFEEEDGVQALVLELVEGQTLDERLAAGRLSMEECLVIALQIAEALEAAHEKGIIHRDLKPQNVKTPRDGGVKVLDFGLAKALDPETAAPSSTDLSNSPTLLDSPTRTALTGTQLGMVLGTAAYMAPEQARGGAVDKRADIWAFGVVLYEMLTGERLFEGSSVVDTLSAVIRKEIELDRVPPSTPRPLHELLRRCLEREPRQRLRDIGDARIVLEELRQGLGAGYPAPDDEVDPRPRRGKPLVWALAGLALVVGLLVGWWMAGGTTGTDPGATGEPIFRSFTRLTFESGLESSPSLSPDGEFVVYTAFDGEDRDLFLLRVGGQRSINLTADSEVDEDRAAFSPDGRSIAFRSERDGGGLFVMGATGESVRRLTDFGDNPSWSPDGSQIVFGTEGEVDPHARERVSDLWVVPAAGGEPSRVYEGDGVMPEWSPSGHRLAFWSIVSGVGIRDVATIAVDGTDPRPVTEAVSVDWDAVWGPAGEYLYFVSDRSGPSNPWRVPIDEESGEVLGEPQQIVVPTGWAGQISFSADGERLVYRTGEMRADASRIPIEPGSAKLTGPPVRLFETAIPAVGLDVAGDGTMVFRTVAMQEDLYLIEADGTGLRKLTDDVAKDRNPVWSPDGSEVAFYSNRNGNYEIWTIDRDGSRLRQRTVTPRQESSYFAIWSPDGRSMAFTGSHNEIRLLELQDEPVPIETQPELPIDFGDGETVLPLSWSPDGAKISGVRVGHNGQLMDGVLLYDLESETTQFISIPPPVPPNGSTFPTLAWLPDSRRGIVRWADRLLLIDTVTEEITILLDGLSRDGGIAALAGDGNWLYMIDSREEGDLWLATRDLRGIGHGADESD